MKCRRFVVLAILMVAWVCTAARARAQEGAPTDWVSVQSGSLTGHSITTGGRDLTQNQLGLRLCYMEEEDAWDVRYDVGVLKVKAGYLFDTEFDALGTIGGGAVVLHPMLVVGVPIGLMGDPYNFSGFDITLGGGLTADVPIGAVTLEGRGQAAFNFLSYIAKLNGDPYDANNNIQGRDALLLYRLVGAVWVPIGRKQVRIEVRRDDFNTWHMNAIGIGLSI